MFITLASGLGYGSPAYRQAWIIKLLCQSAVPSVGILLLKFVKGFDLRVLNLFRFPQVLKLRAATNASRARSISKSWRTSLLRCSIGCNDCGSTRPNENQVQRPGPLNVPFARKLARSIDIQRVRRILFQRWVLLRAVKDEWME